MISVMILYNPCLNIPCNCMILVSVVSPPFLPFLLTTGLSTQTANEKLLSIPSGTPHFIEKQYTIMWEVLSLSHHHNRPGHMSKPPNESCATSIFLELVSCKSREEIEKFQHEQLSKQLLQILIRAFSKIHILS